MAQVLDSSAIADSIDRMAQAMAARAGDGPWAIVGIRRGGETLAKKLGEKLGALVGKDRVVLGFVDITLYRDDGFGPNDWPQIGKTDLPFAPRDYTVVLVDDVLYTGRTVRSALDVILDYGRPRAVRLAVLIDRGLRELPIAADFVGHAVATTKAQHVDVRDDSVHVTDKVAK
jgi:pyrimidine operon attenuation protein/uracil phosphoribosyltransferase